MKYAFEIVPVIAASVPESAIDGLRNNPKIVYIEPDGVVQANAGPAKRTTETLAWGVDRINAEHVWGGFENATNVASGMNAGAGVDVAIIDTGIDLDHPDLAPNIKGNASFVAGTSTGDDDNGHGSHVAGIVGAVDNRQGVIGVAPEANLYAVKVLDRYAQGWISDVVSGIEWANGTHGGHRVDIINMSLVASSDFQTLRDAVTAAENAGVLVVAAAGNTGTCGGSEDNVKYPARYSAVMAVAATTSGDGRPCFSSTGSSVEIAGPGDSVYSTYKNGGYTTNSGTSMASPHVAGAAALVWASYPSWTNQQVRDRLQDTAEDIGLPPAWMGHGLVDAQDAAAASAPAATGSVAGTVINAATGAGISGATVTANSGQSAMTDSNGDYAISGIPAGSREITASASGFAPISATVNVNDAQTMVVDFSLPASADDGGGGPPPCKGKRKNDSGC